MTKRFLPLSILLISISIFAQKKTLNHSDFELWNTIQDRAISPNGDYVLYALEKGEKDNFLKVKDAKGKLIFE